MKIALSHFRVGETDGVSLEMDKWALILESLGHEVLYIAGSKGTTERKCLTIDEMHYKSELNAELKTAFYSDLGSYTPDSLKEKIYEVSETVKNQLVKFIREEGIDCLVPNNIFSLGHDVPTALGFKAAIEETGVFVINHHHDFWWESSRPHYQTFTTKWGEALMHEVFPPKNFGNQMKHCVINSLAQKGLKERSGVDSTVVPNVFDFNKPVWSEDEFNSTFLADLGIKGNQVMLLQATRITNRKSIELAIDVVSNMNQPEFKSQYIGKSLYNGKVINKDTEFVLAMVGLHEGLDHYEEKLVERATQKNVPIIINPELVDHSRGVRDGKKVYSLWDAYVYADTITYPSTQEGWGNQFLEALFAKKPIIIYEYDVYKADIGIKGFEVASLGDTFESTANGLVEVHSQKVVETAKKTIAYLCDTTYRNEVVEKNFELGKKHFSMEALAEILKNVF